MAIKMLREYDHEVVALGLREGSVAGVDFITTFPSEEEIDTVTLYVGPRHQPGFFDQVVNLQPRRVIFNPGTENPDFYSILKDANIDIIEACTLVMLRSGVYDDLVVD